MALTVKMYDAASIDQLAWPKNESGELGRAYLLPIIKNGVEHYIKNIETELRILVAGDHIIPITINSHEYENSYICSPHTHYVSYAKEELTVLNSQFGRFILNHLLTGLGFVLRKGFINKTIMVNNWLLSTNTYTSLNLSLIEAVRIFLVKHFPGYAIVFRSVDYYRYHHLFNSLKNMKYKLIANRKVYILDPASPEAFKNKRDVQRDKLLLDQTMYKFHQDPQVTPKIAGRLKLLYDQLYVSKYSQFNPQYSVKFIKLIASIKQFDIVTAQNSGRVDGMVVMFKFSGVLSAPLLGYDNSVPQIAGLYRMLMFLFREESLETGLLCHASSGVGSYKINRGFDPSIEYFVVYDHHLKMNRRATWRFLEFIANQIGARLLAKREY